MEQNERVPGERVSPERISGPNRLLLAARIVQVRLRFVAVLLTAFLVVGLWGSLRNYWDTLAHWIAGAHPVQRSVSTDTEYFCPMDPGVLSDWPAICPVCNMDLVRRKKGEAQLLPEGVVARMQLSPYRIQLAGIRTTVVKRLALSREIVLGGRAIEVPPLPGFESQDSTAGRSPRVLLECEAYTRDLAWLTPGRLAEVSAEELAGALRGTVVARPDAGLIEEARDPRVYVELQDRRADLRPGMFCTARVAVPPAISSSSGISENGAAEWLAVPQTAVVDTGSRRVVFVETMPGMFDGVEVTLGPRCGEFYPVLTGLEPGRKVAAIGAYLIDAEARLGTNLAAAYFGAARTAETTAAEADSTKVPPKQKAAKQASGLSEADQALVKKQRICPVTGLELDSMGGPVAVDVAGQRVFICCKGCESKLKQDPQKYRAKLKKE